jgi:hypothetical protein
MNPAVTPTSTASSVRFGSTGTKVLADAVRRVVKGERLPRQIPLGHPFVVRRESA